MRGEGGVVFSDVLCFAKCKASVFCFLDDWGHGGLELLGGIEAGYAFSEQFGACFVSMHSGACCINEANGSIKFTDNDHFDYGEQ